MPLDSNQYGEVQADLLTEASNTEYISQEYYFAGMSLLALDKNEEAFELFQSAFDVKENNGNHYYLNLIQNQLDKLQV